MRRGRSSALRLTSVVAAQEVSGRARPAGACRSLHRRLRGVTVFTQPGGADAAESTRVARAGSRVRARTVVRTFVHRCTARLRTIKGGALVATRRATLAPSAPQTLSLSAGAAAPAAAPERHGGRQRRRARDCPSHPVPARR